MIAIACGKSKVAYLYCLSGPRVQKILHSLFIGTMNSFEFIQPLFQGNLFKMYFLIFLPPFSLGWRDRRFCHIASGSTQLFPSSGFCN